MIELFRDHIGQSLAVAADSLDLLVVDELTNFLSANESAFPFVILQLLVQGLSNDDIALLNRIQRERLSNEGGILVVSESTKVLEELERSQSNFNSFPSVLAALKWLHKI